MIIVTLIPILSDNYAYLIQGHDGTTAIIDPGQATPIITHCETHNIKPDMILITHHHWDHMDGVPDILDWHQCPLIGANRGLSRDNAPAKTRVSLPFERILKEGDTFTFGGEPVETLHTPGHTPEHLCFHFPQSKTLFSGDTLFAFGCGRLLDGTAEQMHSSLQKLAALPDDTKIYCGHEYTRANAEFCLTQTPKNTALQSRYEQIKATRAAGNPTIPFTLSSEKSTNPFLNTKNAAEFAALRKRKDNF
ncbi:MAG: hydroxyacylglutathione hydrolase [Alphaproteobacteria bacterium]